MPDNNQPPGPGTERGLLDSVLLIDGDNDPHLPPDFPISQATLVRVFLRTGAKMPRTLERRLATVPQCVSVLSPKGGGNAADFVMSLHAGLLHASVPSHVPFTLVTADKSLSVLCQELQRVGRQAWIWTSHPERGGARRARGGSAPSRGASVSSRGGGRGRSGRGGRAPQPPVEAKAPVPPLAEVPVQASPPERPTGGRALEDVASSYASRLGRVKDPPSRLKALLNDIGNRTASSGYSPEAILEELKRSHGVSVDPNGRVRHR